MLPFHWKQIKTFHCYGPGSQAILCEEALMIHTLRYLRLASQI